jgi:hypothetical protein
MSTADRSAGDDDRASAIASACRDAEFVRLVATADGDALAATGVLARALATSDRPFQASVAEPPADPARGTEADVTIALGRTNATADHAIPPTTQPVAETAFTAASELGDADPILALAGATTADVTPSGGLIETAERAGSNRRPGVALPTAEVVDGLAHSTLVHAPFSGEQGAAETLLSDRGLPTTLDPETDADTHRRLASAVALRTVGTDDATTRSGEQVEDALRPRAIEGPFETVEGYGDVLDAVAREQPGTGVALALGHDTRAAALDAWRAHGERAHRAIRMATTGRYDGLFVARGTPADLGVSTAEAVPVGTMARLVRDYRSPEPVVLVVTEGRAAVAATDDRDLATALGTVAESADGSAAGTERRAQARFEADMAEFIVAAREAL